MPTDPLLALAALKTFPLPSSPSKSNENYVRILEWLYSGNPDIASLIVDLNSDRAERPDVACPACGGAGSYSYDQQECGLCKGSGIVSACDSDGFMDQHS
jgi:hypothetical protein